MYALVTIRKQIVN